MNKATKRGVFVQEDCLSTGIIAELETKLRRYNR